MQHFDQLIHARTTGRPKPVQSATPGTAFTWGVGRLDSCEGAIFCCRVPVFAQAKVTDAGAKCAKAYTPMRGAVRNTFALALILRPSELSEQPTVFRPSPKTRFENLCCNGFLGAATSLIRKRINCQACGLHMPLSRMRACSARQVRKQASVMLLEAEGRAWGSDDHSDTARLHMADPTTVDKMRAQHVAYEGPNRSEPSRLEVFARALAPDRQAKLGKLSEMPPALATLSSCREHGPGWSIPQDAGQRTWHAASDRSQDSERSLHIPLNFIYW